MRDLTKGHEASVLIKFTLPMLLGNVFQQFYNMVDSIVVGHFVGKQALAAVGQGFPVMFISVALMMGFGMASNVLVAQFFGAHKNENVKKVIDTTVTVTIIFALFITLLGLLLTPTILRLMQTPEDVLPSAIIYLRIVFAGSIASFGYNAISAIQRGLGDSRTPLYALIISTVINVILDLVFVIVFKWGVAGVAIATIIAQLISLIWTLQYLKKKNPEFAIRIKKLSFDRIIFKDILRIGLPSGIQQSLVGAGLMTLTGVVNSFGTNPSAAYSVAQKLDSFAVMPAMNVGMAISSFTGQNLGAKEYKRVSRGLFYGLIISLGVTGTISLFLLFRGDLLVKLFSTDPEVVKIGFEYLKIVSIAYIAQAIMFTVAGVIRGAGSVIFPMISTLMAMWIVRVPFAFVLSSKYGTDGIWWAIVIGYVVGMCANILYYRFGNWKKSASRIHSASSSE